MKILMVFGTRPEAIKMCPLVLEMRKHKEIECKVCLTGQHREMLHQVMEAFDVIPDYNLDIMADGQTLTDITTEVMTRLDPILSGYCPQLVLVHGDTTSAYATAVAAFYRKIKVGHVEAGLRTPNINSPFPEEFNRRVIDQIASIFFAPTQLNKSNLEREGIKNNIFVTGNTVIDSFRYTIKADYSYKNSVLDEINYDHRIILVTAHRRENIGQPLRNICSAVHRMAKDYNDVLFLFPVHPNPLVKQEVYELLHDQKNIYLLPPLDILDMHNLLPHCFAVMTDSGGLQEEAPHFGKPVFVLRNETERREAIDAGTVKMVGTDEDEIYHRVVEVLENKMLYESMSKKSNPYGDGHASERIVKECIKICLTYT